MFCQTCGAENTDKARFCNMCGIPIAEPGTPGGPLAGASIDPASSTPGTTVDPMANDTVAMPMVPSQAQVIATMGQPIVTRDDAISAAQQAVANTAAAQTHPAVESGKTSHGVGLEAYAQPPAQQPPAPTHPKPAAEPHAAEPPTSERAAETWEKRAAASASPFGTTTSVSMEAIGLASPRKRMLIVLIGGTLLMAVGALFMYLAIGSARGTDSPQSDDGTPAAPSAEALPEEDEMVLGMPLPVEEPGDVPSAKKSQSRSLPTRRTTSTSAKTGKTTTKATPTTRSTDDSKSKATPAPKNGNASASNTKSPANNPPESEDKAPQATPENGPGERDLAMEMYASRVRYAVSRYYAKRAQSCFDGVTKNNPDLHGTVQVLFVIAQSGQVGGSRVTRNTTKNSALGKCLVGQVNTWRLPPPPQPNLELQMPFSR